LDTTLKWIIYKVDAAKDVALTDTFIFINDFRILPAGKIEVVGQQKATDPTAYRPDDNRPSYSVWHFGPDGKPIAENIIPLNSSNRQYHFDPNGFLGIIDGANTPSYIAPDGRAIGIDPPTLTATSILSPVYRRLNDFFAIVQNLPVNPPPNPAPKPYLLLRYDIGQNKFLSTGIAKDSIAHLRTGRYLIKDAGLYSVYDIEIGHASDAFPGYQVIGDDSVLLIDKDNQYFFVDNLLTSVPVCAAPKKAIRSISYFRGRQPALMVRYKDDSLSLDNFGACPTDGPEKVKFAGQDTLIPLFKESSAAFYVSKDESDWQIITIYKIPISSGQLSDKPRRVKSLVTGVKVTDISVSRPDLSRHRLFLLVFKDDAGLSYAVLIDHSSLSVPAFTWVEKEAKPLQYYTGGRFLSGRHNDIWTTHDLFQNGSIVHPVASDEGKVTMVDKKFYSFPCATVDELFYYQYMVGASLKPARYVLPVKAALKKKTALKPTGGKSKPTSPNSNKPKNVK